MGIKRASLTDIYRYAVNKEFENLSNTILLAKSEKYYADLLCDNVYLIAMKIPKGSDFGCANTHDIKSGNYFGIIANVGCLYDLQYLKFDGQLSPSVIIKGFGFENINDSDVMSLLKNYNIDSIIDKKDLYSNNLQYKLATYSLR